MRIMPKGILVVTSIVLGASYPGALLQAGTCTTGPNAANCTINSAAPDNTGADITLNSGVTATFDTNNTVFGPASTARITGATNGDGEIDVLSNVSVTQTGQIGRTAGGVFNGVGVLNIGSNASWTSRQVLNVGAVNLGAGAQLFIGTSTNSLSGAFLGSVTGVDETSILHVDNGADITFDSALNQLTFDLTDNAFPNTTAIFNANMGQSNALFDILIGANNALTINNGIVVNANGLGLGTDADQGELVNAGTVTNNGTLFVYDAWNQSSGTFNISSNGTFNVSRDFVNSGNVTSAAASNINAFGVLNQSNASFDLGGDLSLGALSSSNISINGTNIFFTGAPLTPLGLVNDGTFNVLSTGSISATTAIYNRGILTNASDIDVASFFNETAGRYIGANGSTIDLNGINRTYSNRGETTLDGTAIVNFTGGGTTSLFDNALVSSVLNLNGSSSVNIPNGNFSNTGTVNMQAGTSISAIDVAFASGSTLMLSLTSNVAPLITATGTIDIDSANISVVDGGGNVLQNGDTFLIADAGVTQTITQRTVGSIGLFSFDLRRGDDAAIGGDASDAYLFVFGGPPSQFSLANSTNNRAVEAVLNQLINSQNSDIQGLVSNLQGISSSTEFNDILESVLPTVDGGEFISTLRLMDQTLAVSEHRLDQLNRAQATGERQAGEFIFENYRIWAQVFGSTIDQDRRSGIDGFNADTVGITFGADTADLHEHAIVGVAFSYADTEIDSDNINNTQTDLDSYQLSVYGDYQLDNNTYIRGIASYIQGDNERSRRAVGGDDIVSASSDFDAHTFALQTELGRNFKVPNYAGLSARPNFSFSYVHYNPEDYKETDAGGLSLDVDQSSIQHATIGSGVDLEWVREDQEGNQLVAEVRTHFSYELLDDNPEAKARFAGGGQRFETEGIELGRFQGALGVGLTYQVLERVQISFNYDFFKRSDSETHGGFIRGAFYF